MIVTRQGYLTIILDKPPDIELGKSSSQWWSELSGNVSCYILFFDKTMQKEQVLLNFNSLNETELHLNFNMSENFEDEPYGI